MKFIVVKVDRDYNSITSSEVMEFKTVTEANAWCLSETWSGYYYYCRVLEE